MCIEFGTSEDVTEGRGEEIAENKERSAEEGF